ncbi:dienelactone hydrolase family protein [uncultured Dokdonia sp.]|uniref:dienelactone hydrolase family protein n=1 Tax=uncultured Dokdonia sp. TaxID=575653 RepID=UPI00260EDF8D|nr:dienelactone hydrolase family protein [uncultured Dokdonia sp.]
MSSITQIEAYQKETFTSTLRNGKTVTHDVYTQGNGPKVLILIQELPGIGQETLALADMFVSEGYTVVLPHLFGKIGKTSMVLNTLKVFCMRKQFRVFAKNESSPIVDFLSDLCTHTKEKHQVPGVAVIGMCLTGNFAISLMANEAVLAGFASQPSLPLMKQNHIHMSAKEITDVKNRLDDIGPMHCARIQGDKICTAQRFDVYRKTFNADRERIILHELPGDGHSILTLDFVDEAGHPTKEALNDVLTYFNNQLN